MVVGRTRRGRGGAELLRKRTLKVLVGLVVTIAVGLTLNLGMGEYRVSPPDVVRTLLGMETNNPSHDFIVNVLRLPRALVALLVGAGLAVAGTVLQGLTRNALAAPSVLGITQGASLAAVTGIVLVPDLPTRMLPPLAFAGALGVATLIYLMAWRGDSAPGRLILVGVGMAAIAGALITAMITFGDIYDVNQALVWMAGSVYARNWNDVASLLPWLILFAPVVFLHARTLNVLNLGDATARSLGSRVEIERGLLLLASVALAGASVAVAGTIAFVGLVAPHLARRLVGPMHEALLPTAALVGSALVLLADLVGRTAFAPIEVPCGIITGLIGAPYFIYLLYSGRHS
jgi:iron complex transport system permease protein